MFATTNQRQMITKFATACFYIGVIIETLMVLIDKSSLINPIEGRLFQLTFLLFFIKVCLTKYSKAEYLTILLFCILGALSYFLTDRNEIIRLVMFISACKSVDMKKCLKLVFAMTAIGCALIVILAITGTYGSMALTQEFGRGGVETRYTLGMGHPNALQCMVWALITLFLYVYGEKMRYYGYILLVIANVFFFLLTDSKTGFLVIMVTIFTGFLCNRKNHETLKKVGAICGIGITIASIGISVLFASVAFKLHDYYWDGDRAPSTVLLYNIDQFLNGRIHVLVETDGYKGAIQSWSLFAGPEKNYFFDMGWVRLFYWFGIIPACIFVIAIIILLIYCYRNKHYNAIVMITSFSLYSVVEAHAFSDYLGRNYVFFLMGFYWTGCLSQLLPKKFLEVAKKPEVAK